jgi:DNA (cytosine-5)-methyltransferase 1
VADLTCAEICAGGGGQALGLEMAGFACAGAVEIDRDACDTLRANRPGWKVMEGDIGDLDGRAWAGVDLLAGGVPCPPFTVAGRQLGAADERDQFPQALRLAAEAQPRAVLLENVRGLGDPRFAGYRAQILDRLHDLGYRTWWQLINAADHGVPQLRPRLVLVAIRPPWAARFTWPAPAAGPAPTVGDTLYPLMASRGWPGAQAWRDRAQAIAPTIVGGSKRHGGPDLGPTRARAAWARLGVDGRGIADLPPGADFPAAGTPRLTRDMVALLQGFPAGWVFRGLKTAAYRQVGNAFPPPAAAALGRAIAAALSCGEPT